MKIINSLGKADKMSLFGFSCLSLLIIVNLFLGIPINEKLTRITISLMSMSEEQNETMIQIFEKMKYLNIIGTIIFYIIMYLVYSFILSVCIRIFKAISSYKSSLKIMAYSYFPVIIGDIVNTLILYHKGIDNITNIYEIYYTGLNTYFSVFNTGLFLYSILTYINPFQLLFIVLMVVAIKNTLNIGYTKAGLITIMFWLIIIIIPAVSLYYSN